MRMSPLQLSSERPPMSHLRLTKQALSSDRPIQPFVIPPVQHSSQFNSRQGLP